MPEVVQERHPWQGLNVVDARGEGVGRVEDVYLSAADHRPAWLVVGSGMFGARKLFVPVSGVSVSGQTIRSPFPVEHVRRAPTAEPNGRLGPEQEAALYRHYRIDPPPVSSPSPVPAAPVRAASRPDDAMTRSEEELRVGKALRPAERVRLVKYVVVEQAEISVPVRREEIRIERVPYGAAAGGREAQAGELLDGSVTPVAEVVLFEEQVVVSKKVVPKERVRLGKAVVTEDRVVKDTVRKERIDVAEEPLT